MTLGGPGQCAAGQHANADHADAGLMSAVEQKTIILCRIALRQRLAGGRIEHVVDDLGAIDDARVDDLVQCRGVAGRGDAQEADHAFLAQPLERRHQLVEHLSDAERFAAAVHRDHVVQVKDVHPLHAQSPQAALEGFGHGIRDPPELRSGQPHLGADDGIFGLQFLEGAA